MPFFKVSQSSCRRYFFAAFDFTFVTPAGLNLLPASTFRQTRSRTGSLHCSLTIMAGVTSSKAFIKSSTTQLMVCSSTFKLFGILLVPRCQLTIYHQCLRYCFEVVLTGVMTYQWIGYYINYITVRSGTSRGESGLSG